MHSGISSVMPVPLLQADCSVAEGLPSINACKGGLTGKMTTAKYRTMAASQSVAKRDSVRTSYKVLKMNEDTHVTPRTATELGQCHELANPVKPH